MREKYESLPLTSLKEIAKARGLKGVSTMKKADIIELMLKKDEQDKAEEAKEEVKSEKTGVIDIEELDSGITAQGILEVLPDGYGFIRSDNYLPGENDVYVSPSQIRRFNLKTGDILTGNTRIKTQSEKFSALLYLTTVNGMRPAEAARRTNFEDMTPIFPNERLRLEHPKSSTAMRIVDLLSPIGKGQRGMIVSPPKAGKTTLIKEVALSVLRNNPEMHILILLIDERPEEVTDIREAITGKNVEVIYSTFDELPEHHRRVSEMVIGSNADVGSSIKSTSGCTASALAIQSLCCCPPDIPSALFFKRSFVSSQIAAWRSDFSTISSNFALEWIPCVRGPNAMLS